MKQSTPYKLATTITAITLMVTCGFLLTHCKKFEVAAEVIVKTEGVVEITLNSCRASGTLVDVGSTGVNQHGFCWSTTQNPAQASDCKSLGSRNDKGSFSETIGGLSPGTVYYLWAFGENEDGRKYGEYVSFTTPSPSLPVVETGEIFNITARTAQCEYNIPADGGSSVIERGLCWGTQPSPTIDGDHTTEGPGTGLYTGTMEGLTPATEYHVRAFAINEVGVAYGNPQTFTTLSAFKVPVVQFDGPLDITHNSISVAGSILDEGGTEILYKGFGWNTEADTAGSLYQILGAGPEPFEMTIDGLIPNTTYFVWSFAINSEGLAISGMFEFATRPEPIVDERDGKVYRTVRIGDQIWMAQNLEVGEIIDSNQEQSDNGTIEKYCYDNDPVGCEAFGGLYSWPEAMDYGLNESNQGICPAGWHIPSDEEWKILEMTLGMTREEVEIEGWRGANQGGMLKAPDEALWTQPNLGATDVFGFGALPAGEYYAPTGFIRINEYVAYWTSSLLEQLPWFRLIKFDHENLFRARALEGTHISLRCVKD